MLVTYLYKDLLILIDCKPGLPEIYLTNQVLCHKDLGHFSMHVPFVAWRPVILQDILDAL